MAHDGVMAEGILELAQELAEVSRLVEDDDVATTLGRFVNRVVRTVPDCEEACISVLVDGTAEMVARYHSTADALSEPARAALAERLIAADGPVYDAMAYGEPHRIGDLASDHRWPEFAASAINAGYRSCLFLPLPALTGGPRPPSACSRRYRMPSGVRRTTSCCCSPCTPGSRSTTCSCSTTAGLWSSSCGPRSRPGR